jgi:hypothetical protein
MFAVYSKSILRSSGHSSGADLPPENDKPPVMLLGIFIILLIGIMVALGIASKQLLLTAADREQEEANAKPNTELAELHAAEESVLTSYEVVDKAKGWYRIPIRNAIEEYAKTAEK